MTPEMLDQLFENNAKELNQMDIAAGSLVKALLLELERGNRHAYIRLRNPVKDGHTIEYDLVEGDPAVVKRLARVLGFKSATDSTLEVFSA